MEGKYREKYRTAPARLNGWDYGSNGAYFVTICTKDRVPYFGEINEDIGQAKLLQTIIGSIAHESWLQIPQYSPFAQLDEFIIMPDHLHGIIFINNPNKTTWETNKFGVQKNNLASIIRGYKSSVKKQANDKNIEFQWQASYYDRVIRNEEEYRNIAQYIYDNPERWLLKKQM